MCLVYSIGESNVFVSPQLPPTLLLMCLALVVGAIFWNQHVGAIFVHMVTTCGLIKARCAWNTQTVRVASLASFPLLLRVMWPDWYAGADV